MTKIKHLLSSAFTGLFRVKTGYRPFFGDSKVVETSRYSYATEIGTGARAYMSKARVPSWGWIVTTSGVGRGDDGFGFTLTHSDGSKTTGRISVEDAKAVAAVLASAAMMAQPRTGRKMPSTEWLGLDHTAAEAKADAQYQASLFD